MASLSKNVTGEVSESDKEMYKLNKMSTKNKINHGSVKVL